MGKTMPTNKLDNAKKFDKIMADNEWISTTKPTTTPTATTSGYEQYLSGGTTPTAETPEAPTNTTTAAAVTPTGDTTGQSGAIVLPEDVFDNSTVKDITQTTPTETPIGNASGSSGKLTDVTPTVSQPSGYGSYLSGANGSGYGEYLANAGKGVQAGYDQAVAAARRGYEQGKATYGASGESLARAGLTGSGYGDYLEGKAFSAMQQNIGAAETARAASYADYLTRSEESAASLAAYLAGEEAAAKENLDLAINSAVATAINSGSKYVSREALAEIAAQAGVVFDEATMAAIAERLAAQGITVADRATVENYNNTEAANAEVEAAAELRAAKIAEIKEFAKTGVTIDQIKNKAKNSYGIELSDEELADISAYVKSETGTAPKTTEEVTNLSIRSWIADYQNEYGAFADSEELERALRNSGVTDEQQIKSAKAIYYDDKYFAMDKEIRDWDVVKNGSSDKLVAKFNALALNDMIDKTITEKQAKELQKQVDAKLDEMFNAAFDSGNADEAQAILGVTFGETEDFGGAIMTRAYEAYSVGALDKPQIEALMTKGVDYTLKNLGSDGEGKATSLAQLVNFVTNLIGKDEKLKRVFNETMDKCANKIVGFDVWKGAVGEVDVYSINAIIGGEKIEIYAAEDYATNGIVKFDNEKGRVGDFVYKNGKLYCCVGTDIDGGGNFVEIVYPKEVRNEEDVLLKLVFDHIKKNGTAKGIFAPEPVKVVTNQFTGKRNRPGSLG